jgi:hypothetical protein
MTTEIADPPFAESLTYTLTSRVEEMTGDGEPDRLAEHHQALGRFVDLFSSLIASLEHSLIGYLQHCGVPPEVSHLFTARLGANAILTVFFDVSRREKPHDAEEERIAAKLRKELGEIITYRNEFAHGWWAGIGTTEPILWRVKPGRKKGAITEAEFAELHERNDRLTRLIRLLGWYQDACFIAPLVEGHPPMTSFIRLNDKNELDFGPLDEKKLGPSGGR